MRPEAALHDKRVKPTLPPRGAFCSHRRMRYVACAECKTAGLSSCAVECPDCGFYWMTSEGTLG